MRHASVKLSCATDDNHTPTPAKRRQKQLLTKHYIEMLFPIVMSFISFALSHLYSHWFRPCPTSTFPHKFVSAHRFLFLFFQWSYWTTRSQWLTLSAIHLGTLLKCASLHFCPREYTGSKTVKNFFILYTWKKFHTFSHVVNISTKHLQHQSC